MKITRIREHIGAEVTGIDLREPIDAATRQRLNDAAAEHVALRSAMHKAGFDYDHSQHRMLYRVLVRGDRPF